MDTRPMELDTSRLHGRPEPEPTTGPQPPKVLAAPLAPPQVAELREEILKALHQCYDPEIPVNIYELGLIYSIDIEPSGAVHIDMTLTSPACPVAGSLPGEVKSRILKLTNVTTAAVDVVWEPPWDKDRMSEAAKLQLGIDD